ncbi:MAG: single-stranded-DNA-specific exonuclease RecJ, partial [Rickettsiales bacterium]|nr:single-stranded-DNA-specific exonuclease RecJ [Rickettsiales bacterium]
VAVVALDKGVGKASARSVPGFDFGAAVIAARDSGLLVAGGGHAMAAGFTVEAPKMLELLAFFASRMGAGAQNTTARQLKIDTRVSISGANAALVAALEQIGPFGQGNPSIRVVVEGVVNLKPELVKEHHVKTLFVDSLSSARLSGMAFRCADAPLGQALLATRGKKLHVAGNLRVQMWNGQQSVSLLIDDIALAE